MNGQLSRRSPKKDMGGQLTRPEVLQKDMGGQLTRRNPPEVRNYDNLKIFQAIKIEYFNKNRNKNKQERKN